MRYEDGGLLHCCCNDIFWASSDIVFQLKSFNLVILLVNRMQ